jgi:hypothetical protein
LKRLMVFVSSILSPSPKPMAAMPSELFCFTNNFKCSLSAPRFYRNQYLLYFCQKTGVMFNGPKGSNCFKIPINLGLCR